MAFDADPANTQLKVAVARNLPHERKNEAVAMLREATAQGNAEAYYQLYEHHKSWDRTSRRTPSTDACRRSR